MKKYFTPYFSNLVNIAEWETKYLNYKLCYELQD